MTRNRIGSLLLALFLLLFAGLWLYARWLEKMPDGVDCPILTEAEVTALGVGFHRDFPSVMRDPVNGILVVAGVGQPDTSCRMAFSSFRCTAPGPSQVRVIAGPSTMFFDVPDGQTAILQGNNSGRTACTLPGDGK